MGDGIAVLVQRLVAVVGVGITGQMVAGIVLLSGRTTINRCLFFALDTLSAGEQSAGRDAYIDKRAIV